MTPKQKGIQKMLDDCRITTEEYELLQKGLEKLSIEELKALKEVLSDNP